MHRIIDRLFCPTRILLHFACIFLLSSSFIVIYGTDVLASHLNAFLGSDITGKHHFIQSDGSENETGGYKIGIKVDLIMMYTSVFDKKGRFIKGLQKDDFSVYEDGTTQEITYFSQVDLPVTIGIVLDLSGSMEGKMEQVNRAARAFVQASNPNDQIFLIGFNDEVELLHGFTNDVDEITDALENAITMGGTALYDAVYLGVTEAHKGNRSKKALIVITDGEDKDSYYSLKELVASVQESDVQVFNIGFLDELPKKSLFGGWFKTDAEKARDALIRVSEESGGKAFFPDRVPDIHGIVSEIALELRNQYSIGYFSSNPERDGSWRRVVIKLNEKEGISDPELRYRRGYYAPKEQ
ncbi:MAG: VWA domain-containing protein [Acidobacteriota bacterium]